MVRESYLFILRTFSSLPILLVLRLGGACFSLHVHLFSCKHPLHCIVAGQLQNKCIKVIPMNEAIIFSITCKVEIGARVKMWFKVFVYTKANPHLYVIWKGGFSKGRPVKNSMKKEYTKCQKLSNILMYISRFSNKHIAGGRHLVPLSITLVNWMYLTYNAKYTVAAFKTLHLKKLSYLTVIEMRLPPRDLLIHFHATSRV